MSETRRVLINGAIGGFWLSRQAMDRLVELGSNEAANLKRDDPLMLQVFDELGDAFSGEGDGSIEAIEIPADVEWEIHGDDSGYEWVAEKHQTWGSKKDPWRVNQEASA